MILRLGAAVVAMMTLVPSATRLEADDFDHGYAVYADVLTKHVRPPRVDYASLKE
jgi:hypothetical protein